MGEHNGGRPELPFLPSARQRRSRGGGYDRCVKQDNGQPLTIHQLRHSFGSERAGQMDALILRDLMGHKSLRTTLQYAQVNGLSVKKAFRAFDRQRGKK